MATVVAGVPHQLGDDRTGLDDADVAVRLAARHLDPDEVTILRALLLHRAGRDRDALAYLIDAWKKRR